MYMTIYAVPAEKLATKTAPSVASINTSSMQMTGYTGPNIKCIIVDGT